MSRSIFQRNEVSSALSETTAALFKLNDWCPVAIRMLAPRASGCLRSRKLFAVHHQGSVKDGLRLFRKAPSSLSRYLFGLLRSSSGITLLMASS